MNRTAKSLARKVFLGTATTAEARDFKAAVLLLGWEGARGLGVVNHTDGTRVKSWAALAALLIEGTKREELEDIEEAEAAEMESDVRAILAEANVGAPAEVREEIRFVYFYTTRVPTVSISDMTTVDAYFTEEVEGGAPEGACQSGAALDCTGYGWLRVLPESMLPDNELEQCIQCIPCHEASAAAYVRKLHVAEVES